MSLLTQVYQRNVQASYFFFHPSGRVQLFFFFHTRIKLFTLCYFFFCFASPKAKLEPKFVIIISHIIPHPFRLVLQQRARVLSARHLPPQCRRETGRKKHPLHVHVGCTCAKFNSFTRNQTTRYFTRMTCNNCITV